MENSEFEGKFEFLEHTADVYIAAYGESVEEALGNAGLAMFEVMTDTKRVTASEKSLLFAP